MGKNTSGFSPNATMSNILPLETCETIYYNWGHNATDYAFKSTDDLIRYLVSAVGNGANFLLNAGLRPDGTIVDDGIVITLPGRPEDCPDQIITISFKKAL